MGKWYICNVMGLFNFFGETEHKVFDYKPIYYDKDEEERKQMFGAVDGTRDAEMKKSSYVPGSYIKGAFRDGNYQRTRGHSSKVQNIIGIISLLLVLIVLFFIAKFYSLL